MRKDLSAALKQIHDESKVIGENNIYPPFWAGGHLLRLFDKRIDKRKIILQGENRNMKAFLKCDRNALESSAIGLGEPLSLNPFPLPVSGQSGNVSSVVVHGGTKTHPALNSLILTDQFCFISCIGQFLWLIFPPLIGPFALM